MSSGCHSFSCLPFNQIHSSRHASGDQKLDHSFQKCLLASGRMPDLGLGAEGVVESRKHLAAASQPSLEGRKVTNE